MPARPVQISIDQKLLEEVDRDPQTRQQGRSAFVRDAIRLYLAAKHRRAIDAQIAKAFGGQAGDLLADVEATLEGQQWPDE